MDAKQRFTFTRDERLLQAQQFMARNELHDARRCYEAVLAERPGDHTLHIKLGQISRATGDMAPAEQHFQSALALSPKSLEAQAELGLLEWRRGNDAEAVTLIAPFCKARPGNLLMASYLAESYAALGQDKAILDVFEAALRAGAPWTVETLLPLAREINVNPACRRGFFIAASRVTGGAISQCLSQRVDSDTPLDVPSAPEPWRSLLALPSPKRISACMIVKNEAHTLGRLLASIQQMVDEIVVVDTGSTDETVALAESFGARIFHFDWCDDFSAARNESLKHATGDWIMLVDADHEVDVSSRRLLRRILQRPIEPGAAWPVFLTQLLEHFSADPSILNSRSKFLAIFPNRPYLRFVGALHEQLMDHRSATPSTVEAQLLPEIIYHHYGYANAVVAQQGKRARNMRIILNELESRPEDAFVRFNYAQELNADRKFDEAIEQLRECFRILGAQETRLLFEESAYMLLSKLLVHRRDFDEVIKVCEGGLKVFPKCFDLHGRLGLALLATDKVEQAIAPLEAAVRQNGAISGGGSNVAFTGCLSESLLAIAHWRLGNVERCDHHLRRALAASTNPHATVQRFVNFCGLLLGERKVSVTLLARIGVRLDYRDKSNKQAPEPTGP